MKHLIAPYNDYSFVADDLAIGGITAYGQSLKGFGLALNVAEEFVRGPATSEVKGTPLLQFRLRDDHHVEDQVPEILRAVAAVRAARAEGARVLVTCAMGRNRSALVAAEYLVQCGNAPRDVIGKIQARRANALTNTKFCVWLMRPRKR